MLKPLEKIIFQKNCHSLVCNSLYSLTHFTSNPQMTSIMFIAYSLTELHAKRRHFILKIILNLFSEDYRQRMSKLMLHLSIISIQKYRLFAGRENGCGSESIWDHATNNILWRHLWVGDKTGVGHLPPSSGLMRLHPTGWMYSDRRY